MLQAREDQDLQEDVGIRDGTENIDLRKYLRAKTVKSLLFGQT